MEKQIYRIVFVSLFVVILCVFVNGIDIDAQLWLFNKRGMYIETQKIEEHLGADIAYVYEKCQNKGYEEPKIKHIKAADDTLYINMNCALYDDGYIPIDVIGAEEFIEIRKVPFLGIEYLPELWIF